MDSAVLGEQGRHTADARLGGLGPDRLDPRQVRCVVGRRDRRVRVEPRALCGPRELRVGRDVLALAEERLVERVLEGAQVAETFGPQADGERQGGARLEARQVDLDAAGERLAVDVRRPIGAEVVAARLEQGPRGGSQLERQPLDLGLSGVLGGLDGVRLEVRVGADDVVVEADLLHRAAKYAHAVPPDVSQIRLDPDPYVPFRLSQGFRVGDLVLVSGQAAIDEHGALVGVGDFDSQAEQVFRNLKRVLEAGGSSLDRVVKVTIYLTDMANFPKIVELRGKWFTEPYPADTIVEVTALALPELELEIEAIAVAG